VNNLTHETGRDSAAVHATNYCHVFTPTSQQGLPFIASRPSRTIKGKRAKPATGSAHLTPHTWSAVGEKASAVQWVTALRDKLQPFAHGVYVNQLGETSEELVRAAYGPNYARLVDIKKKYDPKNVLRLNQNIKPDGRSNG
jgi:berberine-like enzyme